MSHALEIAAARRGQLDEMVLRAPLYERFAPAAKHAIRVIHGLPTLFRGVSLDEIEIYVGRTAHDPTHVKGRWRYHHQHRHHRFGVVLFACPTDVVRVWEGAANRLVKRLESRGALCVANVRADGCGPLPANEYSCVYLTWRFRRRRLCSPIHRHQLETLVHEVATHGEGEPSLDSWRRAVAPLPSTRDRVQLRWLDAYSTKCDRSIHRVVISRSPS